MNRLTSQPSSRNWTASQSSSSGWLGGSPWTPKSSAVLTMPGAEDLKPEAVDGHAGGQRMVGRDQPLGQPQAVAGASGGSGGRNAGTARPTFSPCWSYSPRLSMNAGLGSPRLLAKDQGRGDLLVELLPLLARPRPASARNGSKTRLRLGVRVLDEVARSSFVWASVRLARSTSTIALRFSGSPRRAGACWARTQAVSESKSCPSCGVQVSMPALSQ